MRFHQSLSASQWIAAITLNVIAGSFRKLRASHLERKFVT
jgi:hypothetical protein